MPKQGPKKFTKRDERDVDRARASSQLQRAEKLADQREKALAEYKLQRNPNIPSTKRDQRALRAALAAEGISMSVWNSGEDLSPFAHIARERFVNHKYAIPVDDQKEDFETDPWLQMFLQVPEAYRQEVLEVATVTPTTTLPKPHTLDFSDLTEKPKRVKMSRRQAKEAAERASPSATVPAAVKADHSEGPEIEVVKKPPAEDAVHVIDREINSTVPIPVGKVRVQHSADLVLSADASGTLCWITTTTSTAAASVPASTVWELQATQDGKYTLRSAHGKFLSHCLMWGLVANRDVANDWEKFTLTPVVNGEEMAVTFQTWRGGFLSIVGRGTAVGTAAVVGAKETFVLVVPV